MRAVNIHGLPLVRSLSDLAEQTGTPRRQLWLFLVHNESSYERFRLPKKSGGQRIIAHPHPSLKRVQRWILENILNALSTTDSSYGFARGSRLVEHAQQHAHAKAILSVDIKNFFPAIGIARVTTIFKLAGYSSKAASILARLCTHRGTLPQGAPSSPRLANLACYRMDRRLAHLAKRKGLIYTRYADDMSFSGQSVDVLGKIRPFITHIVSDCGFKLNARKSRLAGASRALKVTGLVVSCGRVGVGRNRLRELRARIHHVHTEPSVAALGSIQGLLDYVWDVDRARYDMLVRYIGDLRRASPETALASLRVRGSG
jgi:RNA-directed DNA polymerase